MERRGRGQRDDGRLYRGRRPLSAVRALVQGRIGERDQRPRGDDAGDRRRSGPAGRADAAVQGRRRARPRLLRQRRERQGPGALRQSQGGRPVPLEVAQTPGPLPRAGEPARPTPRSTPISPSRPRQSRIGAWASQQSRPLEFARGPRDGGRSVCEAVRRGRYPAAAVPGEAGASRRSRSSSGRTGRSGCTIGSCSAAPASRSRGNGAGFIRERGHDLVGRPIRQIRGGAHPPGARPDRPRPAGARPPGCRHRMRTGQFDRGPARPLPRGRDRRDRQFARHDRRGAEAPAGHRLRGRRDRGLAGRPAST